MTFAAREPMAMRTAVLQLRAKPLRWLVTGKRRVHRFASARSLAARSDRTSSASTTSRPATADNLEEVRQAVGDEQWGRHEFLEADIVDPDACRRACAGS